MRMCLVDCLAIILSRISAPSCVLAMVCRSSAVPHLTNYIHCRFSKVFKELGSTDEGQLCILKSLYELWSDHQQMVLVIVNKMMKTNLLKVSAVANWVFSEEMMRDFTRWEDCHTGSALLKPLPVFTVCILKTRAETIIFLANHAFRVDHIVCQHEKWKKSLE